MKVATFDLTLDDQANIWFWTLTKDMTDFDYIIEDILKQTSLWEGANGTQLTYYSPLSKKRWKLPHQELT